MTKMMAIVLVISLAGLYLLTALVSNYIVCFGAKCLEKRPKIQSGDVIYYRFDSRFCFRTAEFLYPSDFAHLKFGGLIHNLTLLHYAVFPLLSLYVIPQGNDDSPVLVIDDFRHAQDYAFCATGAKIRRSITNDVIESNATNGGAK
jgi:hypothetical protein